MIFTGILTHHNTYITYGRTEKIDLNLQHQHIYKRRNDVITILRRSQRQHSRDV